MNRQNAEDFQGSENTMNDIITMGLCYYAFLQTHRMCNTQGGFGVMMCQCRFINVGVVNGGCCVCAGPGCT